MCMVHINDFHMNSDSFWQHTCLCIKPGDFELFKHQICPHCRIGKRCRKLEGFWSASFIQASNFPHPETNQKPGWRLNWGGGRRSVTFKVTPVAQGMLLLKHWDVPAVWKQPEHPSLEISLVSLFLTEYMGDVERHFDIWSRAQYIGRWGGWFDQVLCTAEHFTCFMVIWALEANVFRRHGSPVSSLVGIRDFWAQNVLLLGFKIAMLRGIAGKSK